MMTDRIGRLLLAERRKIRPRLSAQNGNIWIRVCGRRYYEGPENLPNCLFKSDGPSAVRWFHSIGNISPPGYSFIGVCSSLVQMSPFSQLETRSRLDLRLPPSSDNRPKKELREKRERIWGKWRHFYDWTYLSNETRFILYILCVWSYRRERERPTH